MFYSGPPGLGPGEREALNETHRMKRIQAAEARLASEAKSSKNRKGIHKLMQSGTPLGNFVKALYRVVWDVSYR